MCWREYPRDVRSRCRLPAPSGREPDSARHETGRERVRPFARKGRDGSNCPHHPNLRSC